MYQYYRHIQLNLAIQFCLRYIVLFLVIERRLDGWADVKNGVRYIYGNCYLETSSAGKGWPEEKEWGGVRLFWPTETQNKKKTAGRPVTE
jgi:hypothetical protein